MGKGMGESVEKEKEKIIKQIKKKVSDKGHTSLKLSEIKWLIEQAKNRIQYYRRKRKLV